MKLKTILLLGAAGVGAYLYMKKKRQEMLPAAAGPTDSAAVPFPTDTMAAGTMPGAANGLIQYAGGLISLPGGAPVSGQPAVPGSPEPASGAETMGPVTVPHHEAVPGTSFQWMKNGFHIVPVRNGKASTQGVTAAQLDKFMPPLVYMNGQALQDPKGQQLIDLGVAMGVLTPKGKNFLFPFSHYKPTTAWPASTAQIHVKKHLIVMANKV